MHSGLLVVKSDSLISDRSRGVPWVPRNPPFCRFACMRRRPRARSRAQSKTFWTAVPPFQNHPPLLIKWTYYYYYPLFLPPFFLLPPSILFTHPPLLPFSHLLKRQNKVQHAIEDLYGQAEFSPDVISRTSKTLRQSDMPAFSIVDNLVEEEVCTCDITMM